MLMNGPLSKIKPLNYRLHYERDEHMAKKGYEKENVFNKDGKRRYN